MAELGRVLIYEASRDWLVRTIRLLCSVLSVKSQRMCDGINMVRFFACIDFRGQLTVSGEVNTPCGVADVEFIDPREPVKVSPLPLTRTIVGMSYLKPASTLDMSSRVYIDRLCLFFELGLYS